MNEMIVHRILYETSSRNLLIWFQKKVTPLSLSSLTCGGRGRCSQRRGRGLRNKSWGRYHEPSQHLGPGQPERGLSFSSYLSYCLTKCFPTVPTYKRLGLKTYNLCQNSKQTNFTRFLFSPSLVSWVWWLWHRSSRQAAPAGWGRWWLRRCLECHHLGKQLILK